MMKKYISVITTIICLFISTISHANTQEQEINKKNAIKFYDQVINQKKFETASKYLGSRYTQHNPTAADGAEGLRSFIQFLRKNYPNAHSKIIRVFADGKYVILHVHSIREPGTQGRAIFDLFKFENGKIVEHWDVVQNIPNKSANSNSMF